MIFNNIANISINQRSGVSARFPVSGELLIRRLDRLPGIYQAIAMVKVEIRVVFRTEFTVNIVDRIPFRQNLLVTVFVMGIDGVISGRSEPLAADQTFTMGCISHTHT